MADGTECGLDFGREGALEGIDAGPFETLIDKRGILSGMEFPFAQPDPVEQREELRGVSPRTSGAGSPRRTASPLSTVEPDHDRGAAPPGASGMTTPSSDAVGSLTSAPTLSIAAVRLSCARSRSSAIPR